MNYASFQIEAAGIMNYSALNGNMGEQPGYVYKFFEDDEEWKNLPFSIISSNEKDKR